MNETGTDCKLAFLLEEMMTKVGFYEVRLWLLEDYLTKTTVDGVRPTLDHMVGAFQSDKGYKVKIRSQSYFSTRLKFLYGAFFPMYENSSCASPLPLKTLEEYETLVRPSMGREDVGMVLRRLANGWGMMDRRWNGRIIYTSLVDEINKVTFSLWMEAARFAVILMKKKYMPYILCMFFTEVFFCLK